jgi:ATP-dependent Clp protease ATP-binding subunit ClpC
LAGNFSVATMAGIVGVSVDADLTRAKLALEKYLMWAHKQEPWADPPDLSDPQTAWVDISLRGQDTAKQERFPSEHTTEFRCHFAWGQLADNSLRWVLPKLGLSFNCQQESLLRELVEECVRDSFSGKSLSGIIQGLSYSELETGWLHFRLPTSSPTLENVPSQSALRMVAVPLGTRSGSQNFRTAWERRAEVAEVTTLLQDRRRNVLLVGPSGFGKTTILAEAVRSLYREMATAKKQGQTYGNETTETSEAEPVSPQKSPMFWLTNGARLVSGMQYLGQWEERCEQVIEELVEVRGVLCVENLLDLVLTGSKSPESSVAAFFRNFLANRELRMVGEVTPRELESMRRLLPGFDNLFEVVVIRSMSETLALTVLDTIANDYRRNHHFEVQPAAVRLTWNLHRRFLPYDPFPGRCVKFWRRLLHDAVPSPQIRTVEAKSIEIDVDRVVNAFVNNRSA